MEVIEAGYKDPKVLEFNWVITDYCQFQCSYCNVFASNKVPDAYIQKNKMWKFVIAKLKKIDMPFTILVLGGEPTLHEDLYEILEALTNIPNCTNTELITNFAKPNKYYEQFNKLNDKFDMMISYHPEYDTVFMEKLYDFTPTFGLKISVSLLDDYLDKCKIVLENTKFPSSPAFLSDTTGWKNENRIPESFNRYFVEGADEVDIPYAFSDGTTKTFKKFEIHSQNLHKFKGYQCRQTTYRISPNGNFYDSCTSANMGLMITTEKLLQYNTCIVDCCRCSDYYKFNKKK